MHQDNDASRQIDRRDQIAKAKGLADLAPRTSVGRYKGTHAGFAQIYLNRFTGLVCEAYVEVTDDECQVAGLLLRCCCYSLLTHDGYVPIRPALVSEQLSLHPSQPHELLRPLV